MTPSLTSQQGVDLINQHCGTQYEESDLTYQTADAMFPNTAGPFSSPGRIVGHAFTNFTIEAYSVDCNACIFCNGRLLEIDEQFDSLDQKDLMSLRAREK